MAEVYKGYQESLDRFVAIKLMHAFLVSDQDFLNRFQREARAMAALNHPNIVGVYDFDVYGENSYYLVMEYIQGGTLKERLGALAREGKRMPLENVVKMIAEIADALAYAHRRDMVHRDIKPANIMLNNDTGRAVLTDFGIVKLLGNQSMAYTATGALIGTPAYMSPEQALGQSGDHRVDIYSLGVMLFQMVTGTLPFDADTPLAVVMQHVNTPTPQPNSIIPDIPWGLQEVILKAMAKSADERYQSAGEFAAALRAVDLTATGSRPATAVPPPKPPADYPTPAQTEVMMPEPETAVVSPTPEPTTESKKRPAWLFPVIGVVVLAIVGSILAASGVFSPDSEPTPTTPAVAEVEDTATPTVTNTATPSNTPAPDIAATNFAQLVIDLTREARSTETPTPSKTPTATATSSPTVNATALFLADCEPGVELVTVSRSGFLSNAITTQFSFTAAWVLRNSGTCPWPADLEWEYLEGELFDYDDEPVPLEEVVPPDEEITLTAPLRAPNAPGTYESTWQLVDKNGEPFGEPVTFEFRAFLPPTSTPMATATTVASPTSQSTGADGQVAWTPGIIDNCEYIGADWRCRLTIQPYIDGTDLVGDYTVFVFDLPGGQATTYRGQGPFFHFVIARRCAAYNQSIRIIDDLTGTELNATVYVDPENYFPGGCTEP
ncbi:protein kinase domain-containing protein [Candidatus Leptofilum sp.]|uniref:protein kinase domain-containing protein n=1 Tax=Candidatus Leptofilum sp. TaxID=3241576 RepID=UPI003B59F994